MRELERDDLMASKIEIQIYLVRTSQAHQAPGENRIGSALRMQSTFTDWL